MNAQYKRKSPESKPKGVQHTASNWYLWLWLSPLLTIPTLVFIYISVDPVLMGLICPDGYSNCDFQLYQKAAMLAAVLGSSLWHLVLLIPSLERKNEFVRWHGRQMFVLAGIRTAVPVVLILKFEDFEGLLISAVVLIIVWLVGNLWGQNQAKRGDCSLMRWTGRQELLPGPQVEVKQDLEQEINDLMKTLRFSKDGFKRSKALAELQTLGLVEDL